MHADKTTEDKDTDRGFLNDQLWSDDLDHVSISGTHDVGHVTSPIPCATLIERVVGFMDKYNESWHG
jgi:hypothetical protein